MRKIKVAQIGMTSYSHGIQAFQSLVKSDIFEVAGYCLPENERERIPETLACFEGYKELTLEEILGDPEIEAVTVETDEVYLTKYALMATRAKKHIHIEKPGGRELEDFEELINTAKNNGTVLHFAYMYRYNPFVKDLISRIKQGELGDIISVEAQMNCSHPDHVRDWLKNFKGGMMFFLGCHLVDLVLQIQGTPKNILPFNQSSRKNGIDSEDFGFALFEYENGVSFIKTTACEIGGFNRRQLVVNGTKGTIELKPFEVNLLPDQYTEKTEYFEDEWNTKGEHFKSEVHNRYFPMIEAFGKMALGEIQNPYTYDYELELYKTVLKACGEL